MKKQQESTIVDIAAELKLSIATVSRALHNDPIVKQATRDRVMKVASKLGYRRNILASGLRSKISKTIGLIVPRISMFFHAEVITEIQNRLHEYGFSLVICQSNDQPALEKELVETLYASRVDAVIAACTLNTTDFSHFDIFLKNGVPVIFYDRVPDDESVHTVKGDDFRGGYLAGEHLIQVGCKRPAFISGPLTTNLYRDRSAGFLKALQQHQVSIPNGWIFNHELTEENARESLKALFSKKTKPDGIFTANDVIAITAIEFAKETGIRVPADLKIIGYSNDPRSAIISPSISTIEQFPQVVGTKIVEQLMDIFRELENMGETVKHTITIPVQLIRRMST